MTNAQLLVVAVCLSIIGFAGWAVVDVYRQWRRRLGDCFAPSLSSASRIEPVPVSPVPASINYRKGYNQ